MNSCADDIEAQVGIPVLRIMDCTGAKIKKSDITTVALIGTKYTMEAGFYKDRLEQGYGLKVVVPDEPDRDYINEILFDELCFGKKCSRTRERIVGIIDSMVDEKGAEGVILGCTELPLLLGQKDIAVPVFDTMQIHVEAAVDYAVKGS
jgi:aspartate racemase